MLGFSLKFLLRDEIHMHVCRIDVINYIVVACGDLVVSRHQGKAHCSVLTTAFFF